MNEFQIISFEPTNLNFIFDASAAKRVEASVADLRYQANGEYRVATIVKYKEDHEINPYDGVVYNEFQLFAESDDLSTEWLKKLVEFEPKTRIKLLYL